MWLDVRTSSTVDTLLKTIPDQDKNYFQSVCGLPLSTYFSGVKLRWLKDNIPEVAEAIENDTCLFGTVDTWLLWNLTGGINGGIHITDVTNASRTMLMNIRSRLWDDAMCQFFDISPNVLPEIKSSSEVYGVFAKGPLAVRHQIDLDHSKNQTISNTIFFTGMSIVRLFGRSTSSSGWTTMSFNWSSESNLWNRLFFVM